MTFPIPTNYVHRLRDNSFNDSEPITIKQISNGNFQGDYIVSQNKVFEIIKHRAKTFVLLDEFKCTKELDRCEFGVSLFGIPSDLIITKSAVSGIDDGDEMNRQKIFYRQCIGTSIISRNMITPINDNDCVELKMLRNCVSDEIYSKLDEYFCMYDDVKNIILKYDIDFPNQSKHLVKQWMNNTYLQAHTIISNKWQSDKGLLILKTRKETNGNINVNEQIYDGIKSKEHLIKELKDAIIKKLEIIHDNSLANILYSETPNDQFIYKLNDNHYRISDGSFVGFSFDKNENINNENRRDLYATTCLDINININKCMYHCYPTIKSESEFYNKNISFYMEKINVTSKKQIDNLIKNYDIKRSNEHGTMKITLDDIGKKSRASACIYDVARQNLHGYSDILKPKSKSKHKPKSK